MRWVCEKVSTGVVSPLCALVSEKGRRVIGTKTPFLHKLNFEGPRNGAQLGGGVWQVTSRNVGRLKIFWYCDEGGDLRAWKRSGSCNMEEDLNYDGDEVPLSPSRHPLETGSCWIRRQILGTRPLDIYLWCCFLEARIHADTSMSRRHTCFNIANIFFHRIEVFGTWNNETIFSFCNFINFPCWHDK